MTAVAGIGGGDIYMTLYIRKKFHWNVGKILRRAQDDIRDAEGSAPYRGISWMMRGSAWKPTPTEKAG
jgi:hypothetical protein